jgi:hypothetical protein
MSWTSKRERERMRSIGAKRCCGLDGRQNSTRPRRDSLVVNDVPFIPSAQRRWGSFPRIVLGEIAPGFPPRSRCTWQRGYVAVRGLTPGRSNRRVRVSVRSMFGTCMPVQICVCVRPNMFISERTRLPIFGQRQRIGRL